MILNELQLAYEEYVGDYGRQPSLVVCSARFASKYVDALHTNGVQNKAGVLKTQLVRGWLAFNGVPVCVKDGTGWFVFM